MKYYILQKELNGFQFIPGFSVYDTIEDAVGCIERELYNNSESIVSDFTVILGKELRVAKEKRIVVTIREHE